MNEVFYNLSDETLSIIRFYDDGEVIGLTGGKTGNYDKKIFESFDRNHQIVKLYPDLFEKGTYSKNNNEIIFILKSLKNNVEVEYKGQIVNSDEIIFNCISYSTNHRSIKRYNSKNLFPLKNDLIKISDSNYPIILIPNKIRSSLINEPTNENIYNYLNIDIPKLDLIKEPIKPDTYEYITYETSKFQSNGFMTLAYLPMIVFFGIMGFYFLTTSNPLLSLLFFVLVIFLIPNLGKFKNEKTNRKEYFSNEEYQNKIIQYKKDLEIVKNKNIELKLKYEKRIYEIEESVRLNIDKLKMDIYLNTLKPITFSKRNLENIKRGKFELSFLNLLYNEFGEQIKIDFAPNLEYQTYYPDFTFICNKTNLHIDIEIDEPYTLVDKLPIHHNESKDDERNKFFLEQNWCVIRFSEKQIATQPHKCLELLKSFINNLLNKKDETYENFVEKDSRWSYEQSLIMIHNDYRNKY